MQCLAFDRDRSFVRASLVSMLVILILMLGMPPASAKTKTAKVSLVTKKTGAVVGGDSTWIQVDWKAKGGEATDFQVVVTNPDPGWEIRYPDNPEYTGSYTSLWADATLADGEIDFTAIHVTVPYNARKNVTLKLTATYTTGGKEESKGFTVKVPVTSYTGSDLTQVTTDIGSVAAPGWVSVDFRGDAPRLDDFAMTVTAASGMTVDYPSSGAFTSLAHDARLEGGESDFAAFYLDPSGAAAGSYDLSVQVTYTKDATQGSWTGSITVTVP